MSVSAARSAPPVLISMKFSFSLVARTRIASVYAARLSFRAASLPSKGTGATSATRRPSSASSAISFSYAAMNCGSFASPASDSICPNCVSTTVAPASRSCCRHSRCCRQLLEELAAPASRHCSNTVSPSQPKLRTLILPSGFAAIRCVWRKPLKRVRSIFEPPVSAMTSCSCTLTALFSSTGVGGSSVSTKSL